MTLILKDHRWRLTAIAALATFGASAANASLVLGAPENFSGTGLGAVNTILTITSPASSSFEQGAVGRNADGTEFTSGDVQAQTLTRTLGQLGITSASSLRVVFNASEPGNAAAQGITLSNLVLNIYSAAGSVLFSSGAFSPVSFADTANGTGNSGFVFGLDAAQAVAAQAAAFSGDFAGNWIGLSASASDATGGLETFYVANSAATVGAVPEPGTYAMLLAGLGVVAFVWRRQRPSRARRA
ncbi:MAG TPA: PEP-CTERM sorting domain-containing protein [Burkholderiaceae bacterium]|nr:PEP-CTERM sorting domain-containing protein [Burkholderiaceae bacterium]